MINEEITPENALKWLNECRASLHYGDRDGQAAAWMVVHSLCVQLGMPKSELKTGLEKVVAFIRKLDHDNQNLE